jgi:hypothetical protein
MFQTYGNLTNHNGNSKVKRLASLAASLTLRRLGSGNHLERIFHRYQTKLRKVRFLFLAQNLKKNIARPGWSRSRNSG